jgi:5'-nucleotidase
MISWNRVNTVLLDMDGTLLDLHFDNHFWHEYVPRQYAERHGVELAKARVDLAARYKKVEGTLDWYCVDYWTRELGLDIAQLKRQIAERIAVHPHVIDFLAAVRAHGKRLVLVTNAHGKALAVKLERTCLDDHFDSLVCSHDLGAPKEQIAFWERLHKVEPYDVRTSVLIDDSLPVLRAARRYGIGQLVAVAHPDSRQPRRNVVEFPAIANLAEVMPGQKAELQT